MPSSPAPTEQILVGIGVAPGIGRGRVMLVDRRKQAHAKHRVEPGAIDEELRRIEAAWSEARDALVTLRDKAGEHSGIVEAHLLMLADPMLVDGARRHIVDDRKCAEWAIKATVQEIRARFDALGDAYFRERRSDVDFVGDRLLDALSPSEMPLDVAAAEDAVVVAHDLSPGDAISLSKRGVRAFVTEVGGATSHTAILARALEIPAVIACKGVLEKAAAGEVCLVDGERGEVVLSPTPTAVARFDGETARRTAASEALRREEGLPAQTTDGRRVLLLANIEIPEEVAPAVRRGAEGIGLYRSEFLFLNRGTIPQAPEHERVCAAILQDLGDRPATLRTFDLGSDKMSAAMRAPREQNPALGLRGVRLGLARPVALRAQLRGMAAALGASPHGQLLVPMIGNLDELRAVKAILREETDALRQEGRAVRDDVKVGVMIELPAAVWIADELAREADFFSVGTNDLIQYLLAIDRSNEHVAHLYDPLHPAVLRALAHVIDAGHRRGISVGLCGELASEPRLTPICVGLGFDSLSMPTSSLQAVKHAVREVSYEGAKALVAACAAAGSAAEAAAILKGASRT